MVGQAKCSEIRRQGGHTRTFRSRQASQAFRVRFLYVGIPGLKTSSVDILDGRKEERTEQRENKQDKEKVRILV